MVALEQTLTGMDRGQDFRFFIRNEAKCWHTLLLTAADGSCAGFLGSIHDGRHPNDGPGL